MEHHNDHETIEDQRVHLTPAALKAALKFRDDVPDYRDQDLRLYLSGKGCDGFDYGVAFDRQEPEDQVFEHGVLKIVVDRKSLPFVAGATIDWVNDERGSGFLVENPNHKKFRGKFYKRANWQERLLGGETK